ncbi:MAG: hypothetical protein M3299_05590 [Thermoproteota archaeon]|nr:hypothetical protein [Thermoproteota archaeon]
MFKAEGSVIELQLEKGMAVKTVDRAFLQGQIVEHNNKSLGGNFGFPSFSDYLSPFYYA